MKAIFAILSSLMFIPLSAQNIQADNLNLQFPSTDENSPVTEKVKIYNNSNHQIGVEDIDLFARYGNVVYTVSDTSFTLFPADTQEVEVSFLPEHNVLYNMYMVVKTNGGFGHLLIALNGQGVFSNPYYSSTQNLKEEALKTALKARLAQGYNSLGYNTARDHMYGSIDNQGGTVECVYTGRTATFNSRSGANNNSFNCEHTFPQGQFNSNEPMKSDIHHLFPTDVAANSKRGNDPFGVVTNANWNVGGSKSGGGKFEPRDVHKGATARAMMYFVLRYQDYQNFFASQETVLRNWHEQFPPVAKDVARNNAIANLQNSRNPFVDYPQFVERIHNLAGSSAEPARRELYLSDDSIQLYSGNGKYTYDFVLYNTGNQTLTLSNFNLSDTSLAFSTGNPGVLSLAAGQAQTLSFTFNSALSYRDTLSFNTDIPGRFNMNVFIGSGVEIGLEEQLVSRLQVYPNPADNILHIECNETIRQIRLMDASGRKLEYDPAETVDVSNLSPGFYILEVSLDAEVIRQRIIVE